MRTGVTLGKRLRLSHLSGWWDLTRAAQLRELPGFGETNPGRQRQSDDARPVVQRGTMSGEDAAKPTAADPDFDPALEEKNMTKEAQARSIRADRNAENPEQSLLDALEDYMILCGGDPLEDVSDPRVDIAPQSPPRDPVQIGPRTSRPDPPPDRTARPTPRARPAHASAAVHPLFRNGQGERRLTRRSRSPYRSQGWRVDMKMRLNGATEGQYDVVRTPAVPYTTPNIAVHADPRVVPEIFPYNRSSPTNNQQPRNRKPRLMT